MLFKHYIIHVLELSEKEILHLFFQYLFALHLHNNNKIFNVKLQTNFLPNNSSKKVLALILEYTWIL